MSDLFSPITPPPSPKELFSYQEHTIDLLRESIAAGHKHPLAQLPTGAGKTVIAGCIIRNALAKGKRVVFVVPTLPLIQQTVRSFIADGIDAIGVMQANHPLTDASMPVQVCSAQTLARRGRPRADIVIVDEAHLLHKSLIQWMQDPDWQDVLFIGLSATPWTKGLGKVYDDLIKPVTMQELIELGRLSPFQVYSHSGEPDLSGVGIVAGDFDQGALASAVDTPKIVGDIVQTWIGKGENRPTICYAVNRTHAKHIAELFEEAGVAVGYVDCNTKEPEREVLFESFRTGGVKVICNVGVLTTGFDADVRCIVDAKPTKSEMLYVQTVGRGLRTAAGKDKLVVLDHAGNALRLGLVTDIDYPELDAGNKRDKAAKAKEKREPLPRLCESCKAIIPSALNVCPACGAKKLATTNVRHGEGELVEYGSGQTARRSVDRGRADRFIGELKWQRRQRGYKPGWVARMYHERFGCWPGDDAVMMATEREPGVDTRNWLRSRAIAFAKGKRAHG